MDKRAVFLSNGDVLNPLEEFEFQRWAKYNAQGVKLDDMMRRFWKARYTDDSQGGQPKMTPNNMIDMLPLGSTTDMSTGSSPLESAITPRDNGLGALDTLQSQMQTPLPQHYSMPNAGPRPSTPGTMQGDPNGIMALLTKLYGGVKTGVGAMGSGLGKVFGGGNPGGNV